MATAIKSKKKLFQALDQFYQVDMFSEIGLDCECIADETYGRKSFIYITCETAQRRAALQKFLAEQGFAVNFGYKSGLTAEVRVSYFKGHGSDK